MARIREFVGDEAGASAVEYAVLCMMISIGLIAAIANVGDNVSAAYSDVASGLK